jgi:nucleotide-binding universal stress UspA family protein
MKDKYESEEKMTPQIKKILYATDLTKNSAYAYRFAMSLAQCHDAKIVIFHCIPIPLGTYYEGGIYAQKVDDGSQEQRKQEDLARIRQGLEEFCGKEAAQAGPACTALVANTIITEGYAAEEILNAADQEKCDGIVLGTHGKGWLKQALVGSVARSVLERTRKPTSLIPLPAEKSDDWGTL